MILLPEYNKKSIAVFGLGKTGLSVIASLTASNANVFAWDDNEKSVANAKTIYPTCQYIHPNNYPWNEISELVLSPGIPFSLFKQHWIVKLANQHNCPISSDIEIFLKSQKAKFICITGTNGKSTTSALIHAILQHDNQDVEIGGNFGNPVLTLNSKKKIYVLELSSFQINLLSNIKVDIAVLLNITPDHIDVHGNMENYIQIKTKLINNSKLAIIGYDNNITASICRNFEGSKIAISSQQHLKQGVSILQNCLFTNERKISLDCLQIDLLGNAENIAASYAVAHSLGITDKIIVEAIKQFPGLNHRNEILGKISNITFVNDSKATNAASTEKALLSYKNIYWIVGGKSKEGGITSLQKYLKNVKEIFLIGQSANDFAEFLHNYHSNVTKCYTLEKAFNSAHEKAKKETKEIVILLSPACSSLDQWKNFEERGDKFRQMFLNLSASSSNN